MPSLHRVLPALGLLSLAGLVPAVQAYELQTDESGVYVVKWYEDNVALDLRLANTTPLSDGRTAAESVRDAALAWNAQIEILHLTPTIRSVSPRIGGNGRNDLVIEDEINGSAFGAGVLAVTLIRHDGNQVTEADIVFNGDENWDSYAGNLRSRPDIHRVALHEIGHLLGLEHPDEAGQSVSALMNSHVSNLDALRADDINGGHALYGLPGSTPANDAFANATAISIPVGETGYHAMTTNINASREGGERPHVEVTSGHSIWWRWTPEVSRIARVDTRGSNFDTVLAVYSGAGITELTELGANDDIETPDDNPGPDRLRTSAVEFSAVAGETYHIVVDGWGDAERFPPGCTGRVSFNVSVSATLSAPRYLAHPLSRAVTPASVVTFAVTVDSDATPTYQWQRRPAGSATWETLAESDPYRGTTSAILTVEPVTPAMDGDAFRCVTTNAFGDSTSDEATLTIQQGPVPTIVTQPATAAPLAGSFVRLAVEALNASTYQWYRDGERLADATTPQLWIDADHAAGRYHVEVTNLHGTTSSDEVVLAAPAAPTITNLGSVRRHVLAPGESLTFAVTATGTGQLTYQWMHDGRPITGATQSHLTLPAASRGDTGAYWVRVSDAVGTRHGDPFFVVVAPPAARVQTWGDFGQADPLPRPTFTDAVATTNSSRAAVSRTGRIVSWPDTLGSAPTSGGRDIIDLSWNAGGELALLADGTVLSNDALTDSPVEALRGVVAIAATPQIRFALLSNGTVVAWPDSRLNGPLPDTSALRDVIAIDAGANTAAALHADGRVSILTTTTNPDIITPPDPIVGAVKVAAGLAHLLFLHADGSVSTWGDDALGQSTVPPGLRNVVAISAGEWFSLALLADGSVAAWGTNEQGATAVPELLGPAFAISAADLSALALVEVDPVPATGSRIVNLSVRSGSGPGDATLVMGFAIRGESSLPVLARGAGPTIAQLGVTGTLPDPVLKLFAGSANIATNDDWDSDSVTLQTVSADVGAYPLLPDSADAALLTELLPRAYSAHVTTSDAASGIALAEIYDTLQQGPDRLSNVSARSFVGTGQDVLIVGFVIVGDSPLDLVVRGIGPTLIDYGIPAAEALADPILKVFQGNTVIAENDNWLGAPALKNAFSAVGAFPLGSDQSQDAAVLLTLDPGVYTVQLSGTAGGTGIGLIEVYEIP